MIFSLTRYVIDLNTKAASETTGLICPPDTAAKLFIPAIKASPAPTDFVICDGVKYSKLSTHPKQPIINRNEVPITSAIKILANLSSLHVIIF